MSETRSPGAGRYQRSSGGLVGAMVVTVLVVLAYVGFRSINSDNEPTPIQAVDYQAMVRAGRADHKLLVMAPPSLPTGWKATSADYQTGTQPTWHLGMLTDHGKYVGVEEARSSLGDLVEEHVDENATAGRNVTIGGETWKSWTDEGGDYAVGRVLGVGDAADSLLVVGSASEQDVRELAGRLDGPPQG